MKVDNFEIRNENLVKSLNQIFDYFKLVGVKSTGDLIKIHWFSVNSVKYDPNNPSGFSIEFNKHLADFAYEMTGYMDPLLMMNGIGWEAVETSKSIFYCVYDPNMTHYSNIQTLTFLPYRQINW